MKDSIFDKRRVSRHNVKMEASSNAKRYDASGTSRLRVVTCISSLASLFRSEYVHGQFCFFDERQCLHLVKGVSYTLSHPLYTQ